MDLRTRYERCCDSAVGIVAIKQLTLIPLLLQALSAKTHVPPAVANLLMWPQFA
jgi:hypothetical protein